MYQSPIEIVEMQCLDALQIELQKAQEEEIYRAVVNVGINVDKEELIRALAYDRGQYKKGFEDATPQWIPVTERLPEVVDSYIVVVKSKDAWEKDYTYDTDVATYNPYEKAYIDGCWNTYNDWDEGQDFLHVTHWMPLPQPPRDVDHGSV